MRKKIVTIALVALLAVGTISVAFSYGRGRRGSRGGFGMGHDPGAAIQGEAKPSLTEEQQEKLKSLRTEFNEETLPLRNKAQVSALELRQLWAADELDEEAILAKSKEVSDLENQLQEKMLRHRLDAAKVLTKEQRAQFLDAGHRGYKHGRGGRPSMGPGRGRSRGGHPGMSRGPKRGRGFHPPQRGW